MKLLELLAQALYFALKRESPNLGLPGRAAGPRSGLARRGVALAQLGISREVGPLVHAILGSMARYPLARAESIPRSGLRFPRTRTRTTSVSGRRRPLAR